jgi:hypothetical protein
MKKRKYEAKTGEEWLQHAAQYLTKTYLVYDPDWQEVGWRDSNAKEAQRIIRSLLKTIGDD